MAKIAWDESEALLLLDAYELIQKHKDKRKEITSALSINLRRKAGDNGLEIDDIFRNYNGIKMRLLEIEKLIHPNNAGLTNTSELFRNTVDLYINHRRRFQKKLDAFQEYRVRVLGDLVEFEKLEVVVLLDGYLKLSAPGETRAHMARLTSERLRALAINMGRVIGVAYRSPDGISGRLRKMNICFTGENQLNETVPNLFVKVVDIYRNNHKEYIRELSIANKIIGNIILPEDKEKSEKEAKKKKDATPVKKTRFVKTKQDRHLNELYPSAYKSVFFALEKRFYTDPKGVTATVIFNDLNKKYQRKVISEILNKSSWAKEIKPDKFVHVSGAVIMANQELNENNFFNWAADNYKPREVKRVEKNKKGIIAILQKNKVLKRPLFMIEDCETIKKAITRAPSCFSDNKLRSVAVALLNMYSNYLVVNSQQELPKVPDKPNQTDASQTDFYNWLSQQELLAGPTCRSYVSAIRSSEKYAADHKYHCSRITASDPEQTNSVILQLLADERFNAQYPSYKIVLRKYLKFLNLDIAGKKSKQGTDNPQILFDDRLSVAINNVVKQEIDGILKTEVYDRFAKYSKKQIIDSINNQEIIPILNKYYWRGNIDDFDSCAETILDVLNLQFSQFNGYTSGKLLYKEVQPRLDDFFLFNGSFDSQAEIYDIAYYLFSIIDYKGNHFIFSKGLNIWKTQPDYSMDFTGLLVKFAREHNNVFARDEAIDYLSTIGAGTPQQTVSSILYKTGWNLFLQYSENVFVLAEALNVTNDFLTLLRLRLDVLFGDEQYVALGDISDFFYSTLPEVPMGVKWGPYLLQAVIARYKTGYKTINAGVSADYKTVDAAVLRENSQFVTFADIVWYELKNTYSLPRIMTKNEFRSFLVEKRFIKDSEKLTNVHKTVEGDLRFLWTDGNKNVTISK